MNIFFIFSTVECGANNLFTFPENLPSSAYTASATCSGLTPESSRGVSTHAGWAPCTEDTNQYLQVDFGVNAVFKTFIAKGSAGTYYG